MYKAEKEAEAAKKGGRRTGLMIKQKYKKYYWDSLRRVQNVCEMNVHCGRCEVDFPIEIQLVSSCGDPLCSDESLCRDPRCLIMRYTLGCLGDRVQPTPLGVWKALSRALQSNMNLSGVHRFIQLPSMQLEEHRASKKHYRGQKVCCPSCIFSLAHVASCGVIRPKKWTTTTARGTRCQ